MANKKNASEKPSTKKTVVEAEVVNDTVEELQETETVQEAKQEDVDIQSEPVAEKEPEQANEPEKEPEQTNEGNPVKISAEEIKRVDLDDFRESSREMREEIIVPAPKPEEKDSTVYKPKPLFPQSKYINKVIVKSYH